MARFQRDEEEHFELRLIASAEDDRRELVRYIQLDLVNLAESLGQDDTQVESKLDQLFLTFADEWWLYERTGSSSIVVAITADVTIPWLDTVAQGDTIRQHLINRLS